MGTGTATDYWRLTFDEDGATLGADPTALIARIQDSGVQDLFVMSHGWNNDQTQAENLYAGMFSLIRAARQTSPSFGFLGVFWPSVWFPDPPADDAAQVAAAVQANAPGQADIALSGAQIATSLAASLPDHADALHHMGELVDQGVAAVLSGTPTDHSAALDQFHSLFQTVFAAPAQPEEDSGENRLLTVADPTAAYEQVAQVMGSAPPAGDAQDIGDIFGKIWNGAKDALRIGSYYTMKARAGTIGTKGLGPFLTTLHNTCPALAVHLIGHSFGARLVSYALAGIPSPDASPVRSLNLVQGAFSHWCFTPAAANPFGNAGGLCDMTDRVHGPFTATFTSSDWAVGIWYPKASCLAGQDSQDYVGPGRWSGMGADGYQGSTPSMDLTLPLPAGQALAAGTFYRVDANGVIADTGQSAFAGAHSDILHPEVAELIAAAASI